MEVMEARVVRRKTHKELGRARQRAVGLPITVQVTAMRFPPQPLLGCLPRQRRSVLVSHEVEQEDVHLDPLRSIPVGQVVRRDPRSSDLAVRVTGSRRRGS